MSNTVTYVCDEEKKPQEDSDSTLIDIATAVYDTIEFASEKYLKSLPNLDKYYKDKGAEIAAKHEEFIRRAADAALPNKADSPRQSALRRRMRAAYRELYSNSRKYTDKQLVSLGEKLTDLNIELKSLEKTLGASGKVNKVIDVYNIGMGLKASFDTGSAEPAAKAVGGFLGGSAGAVA